MESSNVYYVNKDKITFKTIFNLLKQNQKIKLSDEANNLIIKCRDYLDNKTKNESNPIYGINTGFGALYNKSISNKDLSKLQKNLVISHACGIGEEVPHEIVKLMILLKVQSLSYGHSGVQISTVNRLIDFFNNDIIPIIYQQGSLGASGDLSPLAHMSLPLLGLGEVYFKGKRTSAQKALNTLKLKPITLKSKEGLALLNGTQFMSAYGVYCLLKLHKLSVKST